MTSLLSTLLTCHSICVVILWPRCLFGGSCLSFPTLAVCLALRYESWISLLLILHKGHGLITRINCLFDLCSASRTFPLTNIITTSSFFLKDPRSSLEHQVFNWFLFKAYEINFIPIHFFFTARKVSFCQAASLEYLWLFKFIFLPNDIVSVSVKACLFYKLYISVYNILPQFVLNGVHCRHWLVFVVSRAR